MNASHGATPREHEPTQAVNPRGRAASQYDEVRRAGGPTPEVRSQREVQFHAFHRWCVLVGRQPLPADEATVARFLAAVASEVGSEATVRSYEIAIRWCHEQAGLEPPAGPTTAAVIRGATREKQARKPAPDTPMRRSDVLTMLGAEDEVPVAALVRRAALLITRATGLALDQLVRLERSGVVEGENGMVLVIDREPEGEPPLHLNVRDVGGEMSPYKDLAALLEALPDCVDHPFRLCGTSGKVKLRIGKVGIRGADDPAEWARDIHKSIRVTARKRGLASPAERHGHYSSDLADDELRALVTAMDPTRLLRIHERVVVALVYTGALRGKELRQTRVKHWRHTVTDRGVTLLVPSSKADGFGVGREVPIPYRGLGVPDPCPVRLVDDWIAAADLSPDAPVVPALNPNGTQIDPSRVMANYSLTRLLRRRARRAGLDIEDFAGHSGRRGWATDAFDETYDIDAVAAHLGHRSRNTTRRYVAADPGADTAAVQAVRDLLSLNPPTRAAR